LTAEVRGVALATLHWTRWKFDADLALFRKKPETLYLNWFFCCLFFIRQTAQFVFISTGFTLYDCTSVISFFPFFSTPSSLQRLNS
jgi:hypothetical protein